MNTLYDDLRSLLDSPSRDPIRLREPQPGRRLWSYCPCHADGTKHGRRSLSLDPRFGLTCFGGCQFRDVIAALRERVGSVGQMVEELQRRREEFGFSYIVFSGDLFEQTAPIVQRLADA